MSRAVRLIFPFLAVLLICGQTFAADRHDAVVSLLNEAEQALADGNFEKAAKLYTRLWESGVRNAAIAYNAGTAFLRANKLGWAILFLERAAALAPNDQDIKHNLKYARSKMKPLPGTDKSATGDTTVDTQSGGLTLTRIADYFSADFWGMVFLFWLWLSALLAIVFAFVHGKRRIEVSLAFAFAVVLAAGSWWMLHLKLERLQAPYAIVVETTDAREGPHESFTRLFALPEGAKVLVLEDVEGWYKIKLPNGLQGYVKSDSTKPIAVYLTKTQS